MAATVVTPVWRILAEGISRDMRNRRAWRKSRKGLRQTKPITEVDKCYAVAEVSLLTGLPRRWWRGTDRDAWTTDKAKAMRFVSIMVAEEYQRQHLVYVYYPDYAVIKMR